MTTQSPRMAVALLLMLRPRPSPPLLQTNPFLEHLGLPVVPRQHRHAAALREARRRQVRVRGGVGGGGAPELPLDASTQIAETIILSVTCFKICTAHVAVRLRAWCSTSCVLAVARLTNDRLRRCGSLSLDFRRHTVFTWRTSGQAHGPGVPRATSAEICPCRTRLPHTLHLPFPQACAVSARGSSNVPREPRQFSLLWQFLRQRPAPLALAKSCSSYLFGSPPVSSFSVLDPSCNVLHRRRRQGGLTIALRGRQIRRPRRHLRPHLRLRLHF